MKVSSSLPAANGHSTTELIAGYTQTIIEAAIQVAMLSGFDPRFVLRGVSEAMVDGRELDILAKTWTTPPLPTAVIALPSFGSGVKGSARSVPTNVAGGASVPAKGAKLSMILASSQDNPMRHSCVVSLISEAVRCSAFRGGLAIRALRGGLLSWCASHADAGLAIGGGGC